MSDKSHSITLDLSTEDIDTIYLVFIAALDWQRERLPTTVRELERIQALFERVQQLHADARKEDRRMLQEFMDELAAQRAD